MRYAILLLISATLLASGCKSGGGNKGGGGHHAAYHWDLHVGVGSRIGYSAEQINRYSLGVQYRPADARNGTWWIMDDCNCHAWNQRTGAYSAAHVYAQDPADIPGPQAPAWLGSHESLHEYIESSADHGGNPLPDEYRRGGNPSHPDSVYLNGAWRSCRSLVGGRWPALVNRLKPSGGVPPFNCDHGPGANEWHK